LADLLDATAKLEAMDGDHGQRLGGENAMTHARQVARRCDDLLECCEPDAPPPLFPTSNSRRRETRHRGCVSGCVSGPNCRCRA
jgi:hypothetical protein